jgi:hypothetical protein
MSIFEASGEWDEVGNTAHKLEYWISPGGAQPERDAVSDITGMGW